MNYIFARWIHDDPSLPSEIFSEIDVGRNEVRKVEVFADGRIGFASATASSPPTALGLEPLPPLEEIARQAEFQVREGNAAEFEKLWSKAVGANRR